jgi:galactokinase
MKTSAERIIRVSAPGRICLFGEHQDYLQLPVIPCAISLRVGVEGVRTDGHEVSLDLPDIGSSESFSLDRGLDYVGRRDYFRSAVNVLRRNGFTFSGGLDCVVHGNIPINSGTSSSSALVVAWISFLAQMSDQQRKIPPLDCARYAHEAEVLEFGEPGGMMDHYSTAIGRIIALDFYPSLRHECLNPPLGTFVLGDSCEPKDTVGILSRVKNRILAIAKRLKEHDQSFSLQTIAVDHLDSYRRLISRDEAELLSATLRNRDITGEARTVLKAAELDHRKVGALLAEHQRMLRDAVGISTPKIDRMIDAAILAGAYGGKINGSGGGGCMFVYAPENPERVAEAIELAGGKAYIVTADEGVRNEAAEVVH